MTYSAMAAIVAAADPQSLWRMRLRLCATEQLSLAGDRTQPDWWVATHIELLAIQPGWADAWASAVASGSDDPGSRDDVITDAMILSAVQALIADDSQVAQAEQAAAEQAEQDRKAQAEADEKARMQADLDHQVALEKARLQLVEQYRPEPPPVETTPAPDPDPDPVTVEPEPETPTRKATS